MLRPKLPSFCNVAHSFQLVLGDNDGLPVWSSPAMISPNVWPGLP